MRTLRAPLVFMVLVMTPMLALAQPVGHEQTPAPGTIQSLESRATKQDELMRIWEKSLKTYGTPTPTDLQDMIAGKQTPYVVLRRAITDLPSAKSGPV